MKSWTWRRPSVAAASLTLLFALAACGGTGDPADDPAPDPDPDPIDNTGPLVDFHDFVFTGDPDVCAAGSYGTELDLGGVPLVYSVDSVACPTSTHEAELLSDLVPGDTVAVSFFHAKLTAPAPSSARVTITIGDELVFDETYEIPGEFAIDRRAHVVERLQRKGAPIVLGISNHGDNEYALLEFLRLEDLEF